MIIYDISLGQLYPLRPPRCTLSIANWSLFSQHQPPARIRVSSFLERKKKFHFWRTCPSHSPHLILATKLPNSLGSRHLEIHVKAISIKYANTKYNVVYNMHLLQPHLKCLVCLNIACRVAVGCREVFFADF